VIRILEVIELKFMAGLTDVYSESYNVIVSTKFSQLCHLFVRSLKLVRLGEIGAIHTERVFPFFHYFPM